MEIVRLPLLSRVIVSAALLGAAIPGHGEEPSASHEQDRRAILSAGKAYQEALARGDVEAISRLWLPDGDIVDDLGTTISIREAMAAEAAGAKAGRKPPVVTISETNVRFLSPDVAVEDGTAEVALPGRSGKARGHFTAGWVRTAAGWKLAFLRESSIDRTPSRPSLADLDPLVGEWRLVDGDPSIRVSARWNPGRTFLLRDMTITTDDKREIEISQRIGIDPLSGQIHSWSFGSDGGHGEGVWTRDGDAWVVNTTAVSAGGVRTTSLNVYSLEDGNRLRWRSVPTTVTESHATPVDKLFVKTQQQGPSQSQQQETPR